MQIPNAAYVTPWSTGDIPLIVTKTESNVGINMQFNLIYLIYTSNYLSSKKKSIL